MLNRFMATVFVVVACAITVPGAQAQTAHPSDPSVPSARLVGTYADFAGSSENASALVQGLETGSRVTLQPSGAQPRETPAATFTPATSKLGSGEVNIALSLAKAELAKVGISNPTPAQLQAALNGGTITRADGSAVVLKGVLAERKAGLGWGQIAHAMGLKLGALVSASKTEHAGKKEPHATPAGEHAPSSGGSSHASNGGGGQGGGHGGGKK